MAVLVGTAVGLSVWDRRTAEAVRDLAPIEYTPPPSPPVAVWLGDSYTLGAGALDQPGDGYDSRACRGLGWICYEDSLGGTAFTSRPPNDMPSRIRALGQQYDPDVVIVDMGRNDHALSLDLIRGPQSQALTILREEFPTQAVVLVAPFYGTQAQDPMPQGYARFMRREAARIDADIIDPVREGWAALPDRQLYRDNVHPNTVGYAFYGTKFEDSLRSLGVPRDQAASSLNNESR